MQNCGRLTTKIQNTNARLLTCATPGHVNRILMKDAYLLGGIIKVALATSYGLISMLCTCSGIIERRKQFYHNLKSEIQMACIPSVRFRYPCIPHFVF